MVKIVLIGILATCESLVISRRSSWYLCKVSYALKLLQIIFSLYQICGDRTQQEV